MQRVNYIFHRTKKKNNYMGALLPNNDSIRRISRYSHPIPRCDIRLCVCWRHWRSLYSCYFPDGDLYLIKQKEMVLREKFMGYDHKCCFKCFWDYVCDFVLAGYVGVYNY